MAKMTAKSLKEAVLGKIADGVRNATQAKEAIPLLVDLQERTAAFRDSLREFDRLAKALGDMVSDYADAHPKFFDTTREVKDEADESLIAIDGQTFVYKRGWNGINRISGGNKTSDFLLSLPQEWIRAKWELDVSAISRLDVRDSVLAEHDLAWTPKRVWEAERTIQ